MQKIKLHTLYKQILADTVTPVSVYLKIRDKFQNSILLESSDYHANDNSFSYICFNPIAFIKVENQKIETSFPNGFSEIIPIDSAVNVAKEIEELCRNIIDKHSSDFTQFELKTYESGISSYFFSGIFSRLIISLLLICSVFLWFHKSNKLISAIAIVTIAVVGYILFIDSGNSDVSLNYGTLISSKIKLIILFLFSFFGLVLSYF